MDLLLLLAKKKVNKADNRIQKYKKKYDKQKSQYKDDEASVTRLHAVQYTEKKQRQFSKKGINFNKESVQAGKKFVTNFSKTERRYATLLDKQQQLHNTMVWNNYMTYRSMYR